MMSAAPATLIPARLHHQSRWRSPAITANHHQRRRHRRSTTGEQPPHSSPNTKRMLAGAGSEKPPEPAPAPAQLSGSDVLLALQRAAVQKGSKRSNSGKSGGRRRRSGESDRREGGGAPDSGEVRPVIVKSEWGVRLEEMERRLQQLLLR